MDRQRNSPHEHLVCTSADGSHPCRIDGSPEVSSSHFCCDPPVAGLCPLCGLVDRQRFSQGQCTPHGWQSLPDARGGNHAPPSPSTVGTSWGQGRR